MHRQSGRKLPTDLAVRQNHLKCNVVNKRRYTISHVFYGRWSYRSYHSKNDIARTLQRSAVYIGDSFPQDVQKFLGTLLIFCSSVAISSFSCTSLVIWGVAVRLRMCLLPLQPFRTVNASDTVTSRCEPRSTSLQRDA